ncbi:MAG: group 1 truncated hemoglobin [Herbiconiux sp.]|nr:group 1 truncated hemoglobin [Herbiconiux sp.]
MSIFDAIGGTPVVSSTVAVLYDRVTADPELAPWFDGIDLRRLKAHQREFLTVALGGADEFNGRSIAEAHRGLGITTTAFDALLGHLGEILDDLGVEEDGVAVILQRVGALRPDVVDSSNAPPPAAGDPTVSA